MNGVEHFQVELSNSEETLHSKKVIMSIGGQPKKEGYAWAEELSLRYADPVPSLFTFNTPDHPLKSLMGISVPEAEVSLSGTKFSNKGPLLITHWGFSGPAVIVLSAIAARYLQQVNYTLEIRICWQHGLTEQSVNETFQQKINHQGTTKVIKNPLFQLPERLWIHLCEAAEIPLERKWAEINRKEKNKLLENLIRCTVNIRGKTTYKDEFVTCGGILLEEVDLLSFESKKYPGLHFTGELLDVDGITGGYNFQHAWTSGYLAGKAAAG